MEKQTGILVIAGACILVLFMVLVKHKLEFLLNFSLRTVMGGILICGVNYILKSRGISCEVALGPISLLTSGTLGFSGVSLLYAVAAFPLL